ncbi:hypothetical protein MNBD_NITROSPINAE01-755 [hydrothermal vent metagenome]|uniref:PpiC domain-containing protein n=1 Tax=hydrothermal vent metagenome TaxID=652676 RepID=A0A3B1BVC9_9ZZZZ
MILRKIYLCGRNVLSGLFFLFCITFAGLAFAQGGDTKSNTGVNTAARPVFAKVGDDTIYLDEYARFLQSEMRGKFYHGKPPEAELAVFQREIGQKIVDNALRLQEAKRMGLEPDHKAVDKQIEGYETKYKDSEQWQNTREKLLPGLRKKLETDSLLKVLEQKIRNVPEPSSAEVEVYFKKHPEKFTEPERVKVSVILLKVEPSSSSEVWEAAMEEGKDILKRLKGGADFGDLARIHSGDESASRGGDMGYIHLGMLDEPVQKALDNLKPGDLTDAMRTLQGIIMLRLEDRKNARLVSFDSAKDRAKGLLIRELAEKAWKDFPVSLRSKTEISVDESYYLPMPEKTTDDKAEKTTN